MSRTKQMLAVSACVGLVVLGAAPGAWAQEKPKVALVVGVPVGDQGFGYAGYLGLQAVKKELKADVAVSDDIKSPQMVETFRDYASRGYNVVIGHGVETGDAAKEVSPKFPKTWFIVSHHQVTGPNLATVDFHLEEIGFLAGALAAMMSKANNVSALGGIQIPPIERLFKGFVAGAKYIKPDIKTRVAWTGSFTDVAKAKEAALAHAAAGVDVMYEIADAAGVGAIEAAKEKKIFAISYGADKNALAPKNVLTSTLASYATIYVDLTKKALANQLEGKTYIYGLKEGALSLSPFHGLVPKDAAGKLDTLRKEVIAKKIDVDKLVK